MADHLSANIDNMLENLSSTPSKPSIFRVGDHLRSINPKAYDPEIIAIGPFHRSNEKLHFMEQHKVRYLKLLLGRKRESSVKRYVTAIRDLEDQARKCYAEEIQLNKDELVQMLILDGCFIIEFLRKFQHEGSRDEDDPIFRYEYIKRYLIRDLLVFGNQIPFFIIESLFKLINNVDNMNSEMIWPLMGIGSFPPVIVDREVPKNSHHLLGVVHDINLGLSVPSDHVISPPPYFSYFPSISSAVELEKAGISFQKSTLVDNFQIAFENKVMKISGLEISDSSESFFQNLIVYEHYYCTCGTPKYVSDYLFFIYCLVHSPEDVEVLRRSGIIYNLGNNEMVYRVINQLGKNITISDNFLHKYIFYDLNRHCADIRNTWMATLRRVHFNSPWTAISVFAASTLLLFTITQTTFAILSYSNDLKKGN